MRPVSRRCSGAPPAAARGNAQRIGGAEHDRSVDGLAPPFPAEGALAVRVTLLELLTAALVVSLPRVMVAFALCLMPPVRGPPHWLVSSLEPGCPGFAAPAQVASHRPAWLTSVKFKNAMHIGKFVIKKSFNQTAIPMEVEHLVWNTKY